MKIVLGIVLILFASLGAFAQSRTVYGLVLDNEMAPFWYVGVYVNDSVKVGQTDSTGKYAITVPLGVDSIMFRAVGYEPLLVRLRPECNRVEAIMIPAGTYDFISPAKVDRKRRRYFDKIGKLYPVAVQKGLFASVPTCFNVIFQPVAPGMKERHKQWLFEQPSAQHRL